MNDKHGDLQFFHDFENRKTYAVEVNFNKQDLLEVLNDPFSSVYFRLGISKVHPKDQYSKTIGRDISKEKLTSTIFEFSQSRMISIDHSLTIEYYSVDQNILLKFRIVDESDKPHLIEVEDYDNPKYF